MLKELNIIANGLLNLHGYPVQPIAWPAIFGAPRNEGSKRIAAARPQSMREAAASPSWNVSSANGHVYW
ncbi:hypothetical protein [Dokdonella soli]|uniref:Uncharacterized protein n=1 Tax=Dokdonella soli TaxID=529810 RepID=A0ABN1IJX3_9GAMM